MMLLLLARFTTAPPPHGPMFWGLLVLFVLPLLLVGIALVRWMAEEHPGDGSAEL